MQMIDALLKTTEDNLVKIETNLGGRAWEFAAAIEHAVETTQLSSGELGTQVSKLGEVSREVLEGVAKVVKRFEGRPGR